MAPKQVPILYPSVQDFLRPFTEYVSDVFRQDADLPCFKVVPPAGWAARNSPYPDLDTVWINTPIRQHAFGKAGVYRCVLVESKKVTVGDFQRLADEEASRGAGHKVYGMAATATQGGGGEVETRSGCKTEASSPQPVDDAKERSFWASVTLNPPLYGADNPVSFFDDAIPFGWNLHCLGDLLTTRNVPAVPGVTTPMTYFGMWRSFFGWHKEDADLLSINYLHFGAPKVWYCVSPKHKDKFERMVSSLFPQQAAACKAFIRHKDILVSPSQLRAFDIPYMQVRQEPGTFMVLNAAAYHAGFNTGFNCAEAINFATEDWIRAGKAANRCTCSALKDAVRISMGLFDPSWQSPNQSGEDSETESQEQARHVALEQRRKDRITALLMHQRQAQAQTQAQRTPDSLPETPQMDPHIHASEDAGGGGTLSAVALHLLKLQAYSRSQKRHRTLSSDVTQPSPVQSGDRLLKGPGNSEIDGSMNVVEEVEVKEGMTLRRRTRRRVVGADVDEKRAAARALPAPAARENQTPRGRPPRNGATTKGRENDMHRGSAQVPSDAPVPTAAECVDCELELGGSISVTQTATSSPHCLYSPALPSPPTRLRGRPSDLACVLRSDPAIGSPYAVLWDDDQGRRHFQLVLRLQRDPADCRVHYRRLRVLHQCSDGLYYPTQEVWEEHKSTLVAIRTRAVLNPRHPRSGVRGDVPAYELLSQPHRLLATELK